MGQMRDGSRLACESSGRQESQNGLFRGRRSNACPFLFCLVRGICGSLKHSDRGRKSGSRGRRTPDGAASAFSVRSRLAFEPACLPGKRYAVDRGESQPALGHLPESSFCGCIGKLSRTSEDLRLEQRCESWTSVERV